MTREQAMEALWEHKYGLAAGIAPMSEDCPVNTSCCFERGGAIHFGQTVEFPKNDKIRVYIHRTGTNVLLPTKEVYTIYRAHTL